MIGWLLIDTQNAYDKVTAPTSLQQTLPGCGAGVRQRSEERLRIKVPDNLHLILALAHHQSNFRCLLRQNIEKGGFRKYRTAGKACTGHQNIISGLQSCSFLQQIAPCSTAAHICIAFVIGKQLQTALRGLFGKSEMRIVFRVIQRTDRLIGSHQLSLRSNSFCHKDRLFRMMVQVHIHRTIIPYQLYFAGHSVDTGRDCHAACHGDEENVTAMGISHTGLPDPFRRNGSPSQITVIVYPDILGHPCHQFHRFCLVCLSIFL